MSPSVNISAVDLNLLLVLHVVLAERSVTRAAKRLHVTPPAISNSLARLRVLFDDPLLVRAGRGLVPTPRALELLPLLERAVSDFTKVLSGGEGDPRESTRTLTIAMADPDQVASLPAVVKAFATALPRASLRVVSVDTLVSSGGLSGGEVDAALGPAPFAQGPELHSAVVYEDEAVFVVRRGHPTVKRTLSRAAFSRLRHVDIHLALGRGGVGHKTAEDAFAAHGLSRDIAVTVPTFTAAAMVVASSDFVAGMPRRMVERLRASAPLVMVTAPLPTMYVRMSLVWHDRTHLDPVARRFREAVIVALRDRTARGARRRKPA